MRGRGRFNSRFVRGGNMRGGGRGGYGAKIVNVNLNIN